MIMLGLLLIALALFGALLMALRYLLFFFSHLRRLLQGNTGA